MLSLISHIRNEALLLPYWIAHHAPLFDAATIIDYASTDESLDIVRTLAPHWRIVRSQNVDFDANDVDFEVMQVEFHTPGWKIALNTTEYLVAPKLRELLKVAEDSHFHGLTGQAFEVVDKAGIGFSGLKPGEPLLQQLHFGRAEEPVNSKRRRLLHRWRTGAYLAGRHAWMRGPTATSADLMYAALTYAPWDDRMIERKLAIGRQMSAHDRARGLGFQHLRDAQALARDFEAAAAIATDLREDPLWRRLNSV